MAFSLGWMSKEIMFKDSKFKSRHLPSPATNQCQTGHLRPFPDSLKQGPQSLPKPQSKPSINIILF